MVLEIAAAFLLAQPVPDAAAAAAPPEIPEVPAVQPPGPLSRQEEYEQGYIGFDDWAVMTHHGLYRWTEPYQGKYRKPLAGADFYRVIGREDLLQQYQENEKKRTTVQILGLAVGVAVPVVALATRSHEDCPDFFANPSASQACSQRNADADGRAVALGAIGVVAGLGIVAASFSIPLHPVDAPEARRLGDEYNARLRARLGAAPEEQKPERGPDLAVRVAPVRGGGMLGLALAF